MPAFRFVSSSGFKAGVGAARVDVVAARTRAVIKVVFILLACLFYVFDTEVEFVGISQSKPMVLALL